MAWNEPGGDKNDPWKNRGGKEQGPPDLDDVLKNLFGKFGKAGGGGSGKSYTGMGVGLLLVILLVVWALSGFYTIKEAERGVLLRFGENTGILAQPGLSWKMTFIDEVIPVNVQSIRDQGSAGAMLTEDENMVRVEMEMQYRISDPYQWTFSVTDPETSLSQALDSAIRYVVGHTKMDDILTDGRETARQRVREELEGIISAYNIGVTIIDMNFKDARPPQEVKAAFDDAIAAQEDEVRFIREAEAYARELEPKARGQVNRMNEEAQAYKERSILEAQGEVARFEELLPQYIAAPEVTRQRIYIETMEQVFSSTSKIMVDTKGSGNMMYLPLDKIMERQNSQTQAQRDQAKNTLEGLRNSSDAESLLNRVQNNNIRSTTRQGRN
ncbi:MULTISPECIES: FtsH protease activity modulator HflK [Alteromonadaceae]|jgi:membrane protease subunit HflK|uniref:Protein HflK n=1 Tax=Brumicola blandensis TaxID=3075611 RepID=A0AAW8R6R7_9ALTE|nr:MULTISPECIES: FtsH protease activity modulator HflK [unclassified Alteromonas]MDT0583515.1 FtsH protease activity modulator HflK [Alteromonas sp. W409]MDT0629450.1 FtsH protease activity modulator HflK [Alteromonas sp. W364]